jgi:hypothetical protein
MLIWKRNQYRSSVSGSRISCTLPWIRACVRLALMKESRMKFANANHLHMKSGLRLQPGAYGELFDTRSLFLGYWSTIDGLAAGE